MKRLLALLLVAVPALAADDQCDIVLRPAATLLLPYFDIDLNAPQQSAAQTLFTIQNVSKDPQIAGVTLWSDWGYPVMHFNVFLTGYDVQGINLYDVLANGVIPPADCTALSGTLPRIVTEALQQFFTTGRSTSAFCQKPLGGVHAHAIGYVTIDVKSECRLDYPNQPAYWTEVLFDHVLTGDYQQITPRGGRLTVQGGPLVHIRAVPEGGPAGAAPGTTLAHTFYEQYAPRKSDRRQPLPSVFAPRFVSDDAGGVNTTFKIWREGFAAAGAACGAYTANSNVVFTEVVRFDEHENAQYAGISCNTLCGPPPGPPVVISLNADAYRPYVLPEFSSSGDTGGWLYFNFGRQGWITTSMSNAARNGIDAAAVSLANGCTPSPKPLAEIRPAPAPALDSCDIALRPAATLLLPYFDVDTKTPRASAAQTIFTIQNTSRLPQIAGVTLWTDWGYPVVTFNVFLTGYDVQPINLYDFFVNALIAPGPGGIPGGTSSNITVPTNPTPGSQPAENDANPHITSLALCTNLPGVFSPAFRQDLELLFTTGTARGVFLPCTKPSGGAHAHAIGYATIDVRSACTTSLPNEPGWSSYLLFDNVLTGDYQQITPRGGRLTAQGGPLVHLRAEPGGGPAGALPGTTLAHTFYEQNAPDKSDRRQPLPSVVAPRLVQGGPGALDTTLKIWREGFASPSPGCGNYAKNSNVAFLDAARFDEHENVTLGSHCITCVPIPSPPAVAAFPINSPFLPVPSISDDAGGWLYLNVGRQAWVITSMYAEEINGTDAAAVALVNGCAAPPP